MIIPLLDDLELEIDVETGKLYLRSVGFGKYLIESPQEFKTIFAEKIDEAIELQAELRKGILKDKIDYLSGRVRELQTELAQLD